MTSLHLFCEYLLLMHILQKGKHILRLVCLSSLAGGWSQVCLLVLVSEGLVYVLAGTADATNLQFLKELNVLCSGHFYFLQYLVLPFLWETFSSKLSE